MAKVSIPHSGKRVTARDVAERAGVAASTVSRAFNSPGRINEATQQKIFHAAAELGYGARRVPHEPTSLVALLVPDVTNPFYFDIIRSTQEQLRHAGYLQLLVDTSESSSTEAETLESLKGVVDGVILSATRLDAESLLELSRELPLAVINRRHENIPGVLIDIRGGMMQAIDHLMSLGHDSITFVSGPPESWQNRWRWKEFQEQADAQGVTAKLLGPFAPTRAAGVAAAEALLVDGATACIAFNDLLAIGILQRLRTRGASVPGHISVIGCDDIFGSDFCDPPLTTIAGDRQQAGRLAASRLLAAMRRQTTNGDTLSLLPTHLLVRDSTGPARTLAIPSAD